MRNAGGTLAVALFLFACGGGEPTPQAPSGGAAPDPAPAPAAAPVSAATPSPATPVDATLASAVSTAPAAAAPAPAKDDATPWSDPNEKPDGYALTPLFDKHKARGSFPKKTADDAQCWTSVSLSGDHAADYEAVVAACGAPTGLAEYAKPIDGKLHDKHDPRDVYTLKLVANHCYRYFAVADASIRDLDLLIEKPGGTLVGDDKTDSPVAILESEGPWCVDEDQTLEFHVKVDGPGQGGYRFGAWARPKK